jgi:hypothetical protein
MPTISIWIIIFFGEAFKYGDGVKFWDYAVINDEPLLRFCNFVQYHAFVNYLTFAINERNKLNW